MTPRDYEAVKFELAEILRAAIALARNDRESVREQARDVFARIAEDRFNLLVVGRFSRGKSSLMNAVLGMDRLPTGVMPVTSVITSVEYANPETLHIEFQGNRLGFEVPMQDLTEYTTERGNPGNRREVQVARVGLTAEILRRGFFFVDSPGLGSAISQNTRTTEAFLPEADALVMVSGYDGPLSDDEVRVLQLLSRSRLRLFFVLNKQDTVSASERQEVCAYVGGRLGEIWSEQSPRLFSLSALEGLRAKRQGDERALEASGLADFERELTRFLVDDKGGEFIRSACERVTRVLAALKESTQRDALHERVARLAAAQSAAAQLAAAQCTPGGNAALEWSAHAQAGQRTWTGCELCAAIHRELFEFLTRYQHELATFPEASRSLAQTGGLCGPHLRLYASLAAERDICVALGPLVTRWVQWLRSEPHELATTRTRCRLCDLQEKVEAEMIDRWQVTEEGSAALENRELCLPHLQKVIARSSARTVGPLIANHALALERLAEDMQRYVVKRDGTRNDLTTQDETRAAQRALALLAGARTLMVRG